MSQTHYGRNDRACKCWVTGTDDQGTCDALWTCHSAIPLHPPVHSSGPLYQPHPTAPAAAVPVWEGAHCRVGTRPVKLLRDPVRQLAVGLRECGSLRQSLSLLSDFFRFSEYLGFATPNRNSNSPYTTR